MVFVNLAVSSASSATLLGLIIVIKEAVCQATLSKLATIDAHNASTDAKYATLLIIQSV